MFRTIRALAPAVLAGAWLLPGASQQSAGSASETSALVAWARSADLDDIDNGVSAITLDMRATDVPALAEPIARGTEPQRAAAGIALGYGGGDSAIAALRMHAKPGDFLSTMLCLALGQRGSATDRADLIRTLNGQHVGDEWPPIALAALSLGVLRAADATHALERTALDDASNASDAAREALRWIRQGAWNVDALPMTSDEDQMIAAAFRNGIPGTDKAAVFNDDDRGGTWIRDGDSWRFRAGARAADGAHLGFSVRLNASRTRAILSVSVAFGPKNGSGYDYLLTRAAAGWKVRSVFPTWVS